MKPKPELDYFAKQVDLLNISVEEHLELAISLVEGNQVTPFERAILKANANLILSQRLQADFLFSILKELRNTP